MKTKQLWALLGILAILSAGIFLKNLNKPAEIAVQEYTPLDLPFEISAVEKISIYKQIEGKPEADPAMRIEILRDGAKWKLPALWDARASAAKVDNFLKEIRRARGEVRAKGREVFADFGIADTGAFHIVIEPAGVHLVLGVINTPPDQVFLRKKDSDEIYLVQSGLWTAMGVERPASTGPSAEFWADKNFFLVEAAKVRKIEITKSGQAQPQTSLEYEAEGKWKFTRSGMPLPPDSLKVYRFMEDLSQWRAERMLDPLKDYGFSNPSIELKMTFEGGLVRTWTGAGKLNGAASFKISDQPVPFEMKYYAEGLDKTDGFFAGRNPLGAELENTETLTIRAGKETKSFRPAEQKWNALSEYMQDLRELEFTRLLLDPKDQKVNGRYSVEVKAGGKEPTVLTAGDMIPETKEYPVTVKGSPLFFSISEANYKLLFENLGRLDEQAPAKKN